jgi:hypothetical protein
VEHEERGVSEGLEIYLREANSCKKWLN